MATKDVAERLRWQVPHCRNLGSEFYAELLTRAADDADGGGAVHAVAEPFVHLPVEEMLPLRLLGAVHRLVLEGDAPELARHYPSVGGDGDAAAAWPRLRELLGDPPPRLRELIARNVQTNEVGRSAALLGGFLLVARDTGLPLRIREIGSSAGLNLRWDAYRYEDAWGDPQSPVQLVRRYDGARPPFAPLRVDVLERRGCDPAPVDPTSDDGRLTLSSFVWPDQAERVELLRGALEVAARLPAAVDAARASAWLEDALAAPRPGSVTIVFHSIVWQYLDAAERARVRDALADAGARATDDAPLAWLRMEPDGPVTALHATVWPGGDAHLLARAGFHGRPVTWLADG